MVIVAPDPAATTLDMVRRPPNNTVDATLAGAAIFRSVDPAAVAVLTTHCRPVRFSPRQQVYGEGDLGDRLYIITSGKVKLGRRSPDGRSHLLAVVGPAEMFGELSLFDPGPRASSAVALTKVDAVALDRDALRRWIADHPEIAERMLQVLARRLRRTDHDLTDLVFSDVAGRVAKQLLRLAQQFGVQENGAMRVTHDLTQREIAQLIGATRESVNKVLTDFTQRGWIRLEGKSVLIAESECLVHRAC